MKIAFFDLEGWEGDILKENFPTEELFLFHQRLDTEHLPPRKDFEIISVFVNSKIDQKVIEYFPQLKFIATRSTGYDHIDLNVCSQKKIPVAYVPGYGDNTVAEWTFGLILNLTRKLYKAIDQIKEKNLWDLTDLRGIDLKGRTLGVIGTGRIGKEVIKIAKGFSMNILAYDIYPDHHFAHQIGFQYVSLEELLKNSDIITIHVPYNPSTHHLINKNNIKLIKKGAYLVNTSRGGVIETDALIEALHEGILAGAGLDVLEEEGLIKDELWILAHGHPEKHNLKVALENHILRDLENVLLTPHNAFNTWQALERILQTTIENIKSFQEGSPKNIVPELKIEKA